ncbi:hypothetical protein BBBOND_0307880 [Babesia bigemina]|uniref:Ribosome binding protein n=1 Tax=Babesia bigemina TaxID=5866 RepID=A0A061DCU0_BABBI|nr:hypothetical protein BBBOND_0307880 [Babesia bigemina]CDR96884.1 hypothetical protein BBBOND_0307880 [Babesia bigemina]|eukprot:XP_012769070.1 hypothetical protein BBBOND_0307880 [Babesia bigemina]
MAAKGVKLDTLKQCLEFLYWLHSDRRGKKLQSRVVDELFNIINKYYNNSTFREQLRLSLPAFLNSASKVYNQISNKTTPSNYGGSSDQNIIDAILECLPKVYAAFSLLLFHVDYTYRALGGGFWASEETNSGDNALKSYLTASNDIYNGIIPGGFSEGELNSLQGVKLAHNLNEALTRYISTPDIFTGVLFNNLVNSDWHDVDAGNVLLLLWAFCEYVETHEEGDSELKTNLQEELKKKGMCFEWDMLVEHCKTLKKSLDKLFGNTFDDFSPKPFTTTGRAFTTFALKPEAFAGAFEKWFIDHWDDIGDALDAIKSGVEDLEESTADFSPEYIYPYGIVLNKDQRNEWEQGLKNLPAVLKALGNSDNGDVEKLKEILGGTSCPVQPPPPPPLQPAGPSTSKPAPPKPTSTTTETTKKVVTKPQSTTNQNNGQSEANLPTSSVSKRPSSPSGGAGAPGQAGPKGNQGPQGSSSTGSTKSPPKNNVKQQPPSQPQPAPPPQASPPGPASPASPSQSGGGGGSKNGGDPQPSEQHPSPSAPPTGAPSPATPVSGGGRSQGGQAASSDAGPTGGKSHDSPSGVPTVQQPAQPRDPSVKSPGSASSGAPGPRGGQVSTAVPVPPGGYGQGSQSGGSQGQQTVVPSQPAKPPTTYVHPPDPASPVVPAPGNGPGPGDRGSTSSTTQQSGRVTPQSSTNAVTTTSSGSGAGSGGGGGSGGVGGGSGSPTRNKTQTDGQPKKCYYVNMQNLVHETGDYCPSGYKRPVRVPAYGQRTPEELWNELKQKEEQQREMTQKKQRTLLQDLPYIDGVDATAPLEGYVVQDVLRRQNERNRQFRDWGLAYEQYLKNRHETETNEMQKYADELQKVKAHSDLLNNFGIIDVDIGIPNNSPTVSLEITKAQSSNKNDIKKPVATNYNTPYFIEVVEPNKSSDSSSVLLDIVQPDISDKKSVMSKEQKSTVLDVEGAEVPGFDGPVTAEFDGEHIPDDPRLTLDMQEQTENKFEMHLQQLNALDGRPTDDSQGIPNFAVPQGSAAIGVPIGYPVKPPKLPKIPPPPLPTMELNGNPIPDYDLKYSWLPPPGIHIESAPRTLPTTDVDIEKPYTAEEIMKTELRRATYLPQEMIDPEPLPAYNVDLDITPKLKVYNNSSYMPTAELKPQPLSNPEFSIHIPKPTLQDSSYEIDVDDPPLPNLQPLDPIDPVTTAISVNFPPINPPQSLPNRYVDPYTHDAQSVSMCTAPWMTQAEIGDSTDIPDTELFPAEAPRTVRDMLQWLAGLRNPKHHSTLTECFNKAFGGSQSDPSQLALLVNGSYVRPNDVFDILQLTTMFAGSVLNSIAPNWRAHVSSKPVQPKPSDQSDEPDCCALICQLRDYAYACHHQLEFLKAQCNRDKLSGGWENYEYGSDITSLNSPLQAFLTDDWDSDFETHLFDPCNLCLKSRVRMGFRDEDLPKISKQGSVISTILTPSCGGDDPLLTLSSYLNCLTRRTPRTTGELVSYFHNFGIELYNYDQKSLSLLGSSLSSPHADCPDWDRLGDSDLGAVRGIRGQESLITKNNSTHDNGHPRTLSTLVGCGSDPANCPPHCSPITYRAYALYSQSFAHTYLSWTVYLPDRLWESLQKLHYDLQKHLGSGKCTSLYLCSTALPLLYTHGFTPPEGQSQSTVKCYDVMSILKEIVNGKPIASLMTAMDDFLYNIREPFIFTFVALWSTALLIFANTMLYRLDVLYIRSHLIRTKASHVIDVKALLTKGRKMLSLYKDVDYFDEDPIGQLVI